MQRSWMTATQGFKSTWYTMTANVYWLWCGRTVTFPHSIVIPTHCSGTCASLKKHKLACLCLAQSQESAHTVCCCCKQVLWFQFPENTTVWTDERTQLFTCPGQDISTKEYKPRLNNETWTVWKSSVICLLRNSTTFPNVMKNSRISSLP